MNLSLSICQAIRQIFLLLQEPVVKLMKNNGQWFRGNAVGYNNPERLKDILKDLPVWDEKYGDVLKRDVDQVIDEEVLLDEAVAKAWKVITSDQYLVKFWKMVNDMGIEYNELRPGNVGTDIFKTRTKFLIIDISIFDD